MSLPLLTTAPLANVTELLFRRVDLATTVMSVMRPPVSPSTLVVTMLDDPRPPASCPAVMRMLPPAVSLALAPTEIC